jgi:hypothetical protein
LGWKQASCHHRRALDLVWPFRPSEIAPSKPSAISRVGARCSRWAGIGQRGQSILHQKGGHTPQQRSRALTVEKRITANGSSGTQLRAAPSASKAAIYLQAGAVQQRPRQRQSSSLLGPAHSFVQPPENPAVLPTRLANTELAKARMGSKAGQVWQLGS